MSAEYCALAIAGNPRHSAYHDREYGFPSRDDRILFERMILEINQAGLSWSTILAKRPAFRAAFDGFDVDRVAAYEDADIQRLLHDPGIIRNRSKIAAAIENARRVRAIIETEGSLAKWLDRHHPQPLEEWVALFRRSFKFMGPEIVAEFLMSLGYLPGAHVETCPIYAATLAADPPWRRPIS